MIFDPDRPQNDLRRAQDGSKRVPKAIIVHADFCLRFWIVLEPILEPFWEAFGPQDRSKIEPKIIKQISCGNIPPTDHSKRPQECPKRPQDLPKRPQDPPGSPPRASQEAPKRFQEKSTTARDSSNKVTSGMPQDGLNRCNFSESLRLILQLHSMTVLLASTLHF